MSAPTCRQCAAPIEWGALCDDCADREKAARLVAAPDEDRCRYCGTFKNAPGHSEYFCLQHHRRNTGEARL